MVKEEPTHYSYANLVRDGGTDWSGVHNALALRHLKMMRPKDDVFYYHTGTEKSIVGIARVASVPRPDPEDDRGSWTVRIVPQRSLTRSVPLSTIKSDPRFASFELVRISRLSVMPVDATTWRRVLSYESAVDSTARSSASGKRRAAAGAHAGSE
ncbi:MAG: EVE domain-containing protein [Thermoplasmata archaeon]|nr:EVE domain-containing protein [Thermoplasmata archaeon]